MYNYLMLLAGMGSSVYFKFGGTFGFSEIGIFVYSIFNFIYIRKLSKEYCTLIILAIAWLSGIFIADLMNQVKLEDTLKLTGSVFLIIINIYGIFQILKASPKSAYYFVMGNGISNVLQFYYLPPPLMAEDYASNFNDNIDVKLTWVAITHFLPCISIAAILWYKSKKKMALILILLAGMGVLYLGSRAYFLIALCSVFLLFVSLKTNRLKDNSRRKLLILMGVSFGLLISGLSYKYLALSGYLGELAQNKYIWQSEAESVGIISGRIDFIEAIYAILLNPIVGYGSYASNNGGMVQELYNMLGISSIEPRDGMPNHSHILGAWVYSGVLSVPFWIYIIIIIIRALWKAIDSEYAGFYIPYSLLVLWNIFFSPMGYRGELVFIVATAMIIVYVNKEKPKAIYNMG